MNCKEICGEHYWMPASQTTLLLY